MTDLSRRSVLRRLAQGAALLSTSLPSLSALSSRLGAASNDEAYWEMVRQQFPFREAKIPMNAANLCPAPRVVAEAVVDLTQDIDVDCSFNNREKFRTMLELSRKQVADQLGVDSDEVALVRNTSEANNSSTMAFRSRREMRSSYGTRTIPPTMSPGRCAPPASIQASNESRLLKSLPGWIN